MGLERERQFFWSCQVTDRGIKAGKRQSKPWNYTPASFSERKEQRCLTKVENLVVVLLSSDMLQQKLPRMKLKICNSGSWGRKLKRTILFGYFNQTFFLHFRLPSYCAFLGPLLEEFRKQQLILRVTKLRGAPFWWRAGAGGGGGEAKI